MSPAPIHKTKDFLLTSRFSDMQITCRGQIFKAHRFIICKQSPFFESALTGPYKECALQSVDLPDDDPETVERVVSSLYLGDYKERGHMLPLDGIGEDKSRGTTRAIGSVHVQVYIAADKFGVDGLKALASEKFVSWANAHWESAVFVDIMQEVIGSVPAHDMELQNVVTDVIYKHLFIPVKKGDILKVQEAFGNIGSVIIAQLVGSDLLINPEGRDSVAKAGALDRIAHKLTEDG